MQNYNINLKMQYIMGKVQNNLVLNCDPAKIQSPVALRLIEFATLKNLSIREFERTINVNQGWIHSMRSSVSPEKLKQILKVYPELSVRYLYTGEGSPIENVAQLASTADGKSVLIPGDVYKQLENLTETVRMQEDTIAQLREVNVKLTDTLHVLLKDASVTGMTCVKSAPNE